MKHNWNQLTVQCRPMEDYQAEERRETQRIQAAIRARANRLYQGGELARAAQLLMELETQPRWAR